MTQGMPKRSNLMRLGWRKRVIPAAAGFAVLLVAALIHFFQPDILHRFGYQLFDQFQRMAPREYQDAGVRVVDIDEESIDRIGQWPWPRTQLAQMTERMFEVGAGVVAYDIVFSEPDRTSPENLRATLERGGASSDVIAGLQSYTPHDQVLAQTFSQLPVITGYFFENFAGEDQDPKRLRPVNPLGEAPTAVLPTYLSVTQSIPVIADAAYDAGFISIKRDDDGIIRRAQMIAHLDKGTEGPFVNLDFYPAMSLAVYRFFAEAMGERASGYDLATTTKSRAGWASQSEVSGIRIGGRTIPTTRNGEMWVHFTEGWENRVIPAWKLLDPSVSDQELIDAFVSGDGQAALVYVGTSAQGLEDLRATPVDPLMPGVLVHAQLTEQMLLGHFLQQPDWAPGVRLLVLVISGLILILIVPIAGPTRSGLLALLLLAGLFYGSWQLYLGQRLLFDPVYPAVALLIVYLVTSTISFVLTEAEKSHINGAFSRYLSPDMVARIADDPGSLELGGETREMTILFSDIRGFSKISEGMTSEELTNFINRYLTPMTDVLMRNKATVDKYIGDAIMAFWNAPLDDPDHHKHAARAALEMLDRLDELNTNRLNAAAPDSEKLPVETTIGVGLYSGDCSVGNMGSDQRFDYSVMGDVVNTSSRLEGMTKQYGVAILVGDETARHLDGFALVELDRAQAVGKDNWLTVYALVGDEAAAGSSDFSYLLGLQEQFLAAYRAQDFDEALTLTGELSKYGDAFGLAKHYDIMKARIEAYKVDPPPEDWNGVYVLREK